jgi:flagellar motor protein MotB
MDRYEAILELYEAQNAIGIAQAANAEKYAPQTFAKARHLLEAAQSLESGKASSGVIVQDAREAVQTAEDARMIAERRREEETVASARTEAADAQQARARAEEEKQRAQAETEAARIRADAEHAARERAEADADAARERAVQAEASVRTVLIQPQVTVVQPAQDARKSDLRMGLLDQLNGVVSMRDTARGLVATLPDSDFSGPELHPSVSGQIARIAAIVEAHPGLNIAVEGNTDSSATEALASERAESVRRVLVAQGLPGSRVTARGLGDTHLFGPNLSAAGREANRRVEVVISGAPIGDLPFWDHPYALTPGSR